MTPAETFNARFNAWWDEANLAETANADYERRDATTVTIEIIEAFAAQSVDLGDLGIVLGAEVL